LIAEDVEQLRARTLGVLDQVLELTHGERGLDTPLHDFGSGPASGWFIPVPEFFRDALAIGSGQAASVRQLSAFRFNVGDVLYNHADGWSSEPVEASLCLQVRVAKPALARNKDKDAPRDPGLVVVWAWQMPLRSGQPDAVEELSQDDFVRVLIAGPTPQLCPDLYEILSPDAPGGLP
jgi:hypothetical protein